MADTAPTLRDAALEALEQATSVAFQYRREQVAKQMAGVYTAFGAPGSPGKTAGSEQQGQTALPAPAAEQVEPQWQLERMRHIANEWADMATNGMQWLRNIKEGISNVDDALANMAMCYEHCRMVNDAQGLYGEAAPPAPAPTWPEWAEQILKIVREYSGYDGYDDEDGVDLPEEVREALEELTTQIERLEAKAPAPARQEWQPIETAPKTGAKIIVRYVNRNNKPRTVMARWLTDEQAEETDADGVGLKGGWYECIDNWDDYTEVAIHEGEPSLWMPLPAAPITAAPAEGGAA